MKNTDQTRSISAKCGIHPDPATKFFVHLVRPEYFGSLEDEAKKADLVASGDRALVFVDRELEFEGQILSGTRHDPLASPLTLHENDEVVRVTDELVATLFKLFIQIVEGDVGEQW